MPPSSRRAWVRKGTRAEIRIAKSLGVKRLAGPGREDFRHRGKAIENKHHDRRNIHAGFIQQAHDKGRDVVNASGRKGFSAGAKALAKKLGIRLTRIQR